MRPTMPPIDSLAAMPLTSFGCSILSLCRDQIPFPPADHHHHAHANSFDLEIDAFQRHAADILLDLLLDSSDPIALEILPLTWTHRLLDSFLICLEEFRTILLGYRTTATVRPRLDHLVADFFDRAIKVLDLCNALRDGLDLTRLSY